MLVNNDKNVPKLLSVPYYYDFVVRSDEYGLVKVNVAPDASTPKPNVF